MGHSPASYRGAVGAVLSNSKTGGVISLQDHLAVILGESFPLRFLICVSRVGFLARCRGPPSPGLGGAYQDFECNRGT